MKRLSKVLLSFMLVIALSAGSTMMAFAQTRSAITDTRGGTWRIDDFQTSQSILELPIKVTYVPKPQVNALYDAAVSTTSFWEYLAQAGSVKITDAIAKKVLQDYSVNLVPLVGTAWTLYDVYKAVHTDAMNKAIKDAHNSTSGCMKFTVYEINPGGDKYFKSTTWDGRTMSTTESLPGISGYATGTITIGEWDLNVSF